MNVRDRLGISFGHHIFMKHILMIKLYSVSFCLLPTCEGVVVDFFSLMIFTFYLVTNMMPYSSSNVLL